MKKKTALLLTLVMIFSAVPMSVLGASTVVPGGFVQTAPADTFSRIRLDLFNIQQAEAYNSQINTATNLDYNVGGFVGIPVDVTVAGGATFGNDDAVAGVNGLSAVSTVSTVKADIEKYVLGVNVAAGYWDPIAGPAKAVTIVNNVASSTTTSAAIAGDFAVNPATKVNRDAAAAATAVAALANGVYEITWDFDVISPTKIRFYIQVLNKTTNSTMLPNDLLENQLFVEFAVPLNVQIRPGTGSWSTEDEINDYVINSRISVTNISEWTDAKEILTVPAFNQLLGDGVAITTGTIAQFDTSGFIGDVKIRETSVNALPAGSQVLFRLNSPYAKLTNNTSQPLRFDDTDSYGSFSNATVDASYNIAGDPDYTDGGRYNQFVTVNWGTRNSAYDLAVVVIGRDAPSTVPDVLTLKDLFVSFDESMPYGTDVQLQYYLAPNGTERPASDADFLWKNAGVVVQRTQLQTSGDIDVSPRYGTYKFPKTGVISGIEIAETVAGLLNNGTKVQFKLNSPYARLVNNPNVQLRMWSLYNTFGNISTNISVSWGVSGYDLELNFWARNGNTYVPDRLTTDNLTVEFDDQQPFNTDVNLLYRLITDGVGDTEEWKDAGTVAQRIERRTELSRLTGRKSGAAKTEAPVTLTSGGTNQVTDVVTFKDNFGGFLAEGYTPTFTVPNGVEITGVHAAQYVTNFDGSRTRLEGIRKKQGYNIVNAYTDYGTDWSSLNLYPRVCAGPDANYVQATVNGRNYALSRTGTTDVYGNIWWEVSLSGIPLSVTEITVSSSASPDFLNQDSITLSFSEGYYYATYGVDWNKASTSDNAVEFASLPDVVNSEYGSGFVANNKELRFNNGWYYDGNNMPSTEIELQFQLNIEAGYEAKYGSEVMLTVSGVGLAPLTIPIATVKAPTTPTDPNPVDPDPADPDPADPDPVDPITPPVYYPVIPPNNSNVTTGYDYNRVVVNQGVASTKNAATVEKADGEPTVATVEVAVKPNTKGQVNATVSKAVVSSAISKAKLFNAKLSRADRADGTVVEVYAAAEKDVTGMTVRLDKTALQSLSAAGFGLVVYSEAASLELDANAVKELLKSNTNIRYSVTPVAKQTTDYPSYNVMFKDTRNRNVAALENGVVTFGIYNEAYPDGAGVAEIEKNQANPIADSSVTDGWLRWTGDANGVFTAGGQANQAPSAE